VASASSVEELDREKRDSGNFVLETLQIKTLRATPACNIPKVPRGAPKRCNPSF